MLIDIAIESLQQYKTCQLTKKLTNNYPDEMKRREDYLDNLIRQLINCQRCFNQQTLNLLADDIHHCLLHCYYPDLLPEEKENGFNFHNTLMDIAGLIESENWVSCCA